MCLLRQQYVLSLGSQAKQRFDVMCVLSTACIALDSYIDVALKHIIPKFKHILFRLFLCPEGGGDVKLT